MSGIRPFMPDDIPRVAELIADSFQFSKKMSLLSISMALEEVIFHNPWMFEEMPSLVYEHTDGEVKGFVGVSPRSMKFCDENIKVAITHNYVMQPGPFAALAGIKLFKTLLNCPQDLIISGSAGDTSKFIMEKSGGETGYLYSFGWRLPVRPIQSGLNYLSSESRRINPVKLLTPAAKAGEFLLEKIIGGRFRHHQPEGTLKKMDCEQLVACHKKFSAGYAFKPDYTPGMMQWILDIAAKATHLGKLKTCGVYNEKNEVQGWFIFYLNPGGSCEVLQMHAIKGKESYVLEHLVYKAWKEGAIELIGRVEPSFMRALSKSLSFHIPGRMWMLLHSKNSEIVSSICKGDAFISRLEDDVWLL